jgi:hypothetical protein
MGPADVEIVDYHICLLRMPKNWTRCGKLYGVESSKERANLLASSNSRLLQCNPPPTRLQEEAEECPLPRMEWARVAPCNETLQT